MYCVVGVGIGTGGLLVAASKGCNGVTSMAVADSSEKLLDSAVLPERVKDGVCPEVDRGETADPTENIRLSCSATERGDG